MPQNAARMPASGSSIQNDSPKVLREQRVGIGADRVEGDIAEIEQAGEPDHDVEPPAEHHIDQDLDAEIVDPFHRAAGSRRSTSTMRRIGDDEADGERARTICRAMRSAERRRGAQPAAARAARAAARSASE